ncbi:MAG: transporter associated domain-containing protein [Pseudomonadota bacterium]
MGDTAEGSSTAARSAQADSQDTNGQDEDDASRTEPPGFFRKVIGALTLTETSSPEDAPKAPEPQSVGMLNLRTLTVEDVAIPRSDIVAVPIDSTKDELVTTFRESGLTRLPVFEGTLDTPMGFAHLKDFALKHGFNGNGGRFSLKKLLRPLVYVPASMPIGVLLQKMQNERRHMALVIDEYGGVDGLVTIEDLIEQVVGEIADEHDVDEDTYFFVEKSGAYIALAKTPLKEFETEIGISLTSEEEIDEEDIDTLGGLLFMLLGRVPVRGEMVEHPGGTVFEVIDADPRRIKRLRVRLPGQAAQKDT